MNIYRTDHIPAVGSVCVPKFAGGPLGSWGFRLKSLHRLVNSDLTTSHTEGSANTSNTWAQFKMQKTLIVDRFDCPPRHCPTLRIHCQSELHLNLIFPCRRAFNFFQFVRNLTNCSSILQVKVSFMSYVVVQSLSLVSLVLAYLRMSAEYFTGFNLKVCVQLIVFARIFCEKSLQQTQPCLLDTCCNDNSTITS